MSKRSKVVLIILIILVIIVLLSLFEEAPSTDNKLEEWEEEIVDPNNQLDPLNQKVGKNVFIIDIALKIENLIDKFFSVIISFFEGVIDRVLSLTNII